MFGAGSVIDRLFGASLQRDGRSPALEAATAREGEAAAADLAGDRPGREGAGPEQGDPAQRRRLAAAPQALVREGLGTKVLHGWLQNRHQTLVPLTLNIGALTPEGVGLIVHAMAAAMLADGEVDEGEREAAPASLTAFGAGEPERARLAEALDRPRPLGELLRDIQAANLSAFAYAASLHVLNPRGTVNRLYLDYLAARLALPSEVVTTLHRRYRR